MPQVIKHTPGPWMVGGGEMPAYHERWTIRGRDGEYLARMNRYHPSDAVNDADARLMASAPDLLAALKVLVGGVNELWLAENPVFIAAAAAIDKAEGR